MNVHRHAQARSIGVRLRRVGDGVTLSVQDDGRGLSGGALSPGVGVMGMRARIEALGGRFSLRSTHGGVQVRAWAPVVSPSRS